MSNQQFHGISKFFNNVQKYQYKNHLSLPISGWLGVTNVDILSISVSSSHHGLSTLSLLNRKRAISVFQV